MKKICLVLHNKNNLCPAKKETTACKTCMLSALACQKDIKYIKNFVLADKEIETILIFPLCGICDLSVETIKLLKEEKYNLELFLCTAADLNTCNRLDYFDFIYIADNFNQDEIQTTAIIKKVDHSFLETEQSMTYYLNNQKYANYAKLKNAILKIMHLELDIHSEPILVDSDEYFTKAIIKAFTKSKKINSLYRPNYIIKELLIYYDHNNKIYSKPQKGICEEEIKNE